jgi:CRISPR-associated protein Csd1
MILQALLQLAKDEKLIADPDFEFKSVAWVVRLDDEGHVLAIEDNRENVNEGHTDRKGKPVKPKWVGRDVLIPLFPTGRAGTKPKAAFLVDMAKFLFGREPLEELNDGSLLPYVERFRQLIFGCENATNDPAVVAVRKMLDHVVAGEAVSELPKDAGSSDLFMFRVGEDPVPVHARPEVLAYWKRLRATPPSDVDPEERSICLVTGAPIIGKPPLFPLIRGVPGAGTMGSGLLPFNGPSSRTWSSYGLEGNENAPVSRLAAEAAATALNRLADPRPADGLGKPLPVRRIRLSSDTIVVFWSSRSEPEISSILDALPNLLDPADVTADVGNLISSYRTGSFRPLTTPERFYAMTLTGTTGRIIVRDWFETTVREIQANIAAYFDDLRLVRSAGPGRVIELDDTSLPGLRDVKLAAYRELDDVPAPFSREWLRVIWGGRGARVPPGFVVKVINRIEIALARGDEPARHAFSLLKLFALREGDSDMKTFVNEEHPNVAYHCGRLLAVLDFAQQRALGETNTSNVRRMLGAIMTAPALYMGRLRRLTEVAYLRKMEGDWPNFLRDRLQSISARIGDEIPRILQMRDQSTFFLGLDQERTFLQTHPPSKYRRQSSIGLWVMSHGERDVVEALVKLGRSFLYEPGLRTYGDRSRLPDFLIAGDSPSDNIFIEYLGMLDKSEYVERWKQKQQEYNAIGLLPIETGGGDAGKLIVIDHQRHRDFTTIYTELKKQLGRPLADEDSTTPEGATE